MTQPLPVGGGAFTVDITRAPEAIRELEQARGELESIKKAARLLAHIDPPANDQVSIDAARVLGLKASEGPGSLAVALEQGIDEISRLIEQLRVGFEMYQQAEAEAESRYRRS
ncbi:PE domain-containing protein [Actinomycetospora lemnae]|uniref:PE domain-containing protein n=1 Tax=Actinomycetospora lemnae TaxID=3019891 RepID=A0ABT5T2X5_9PSEU|nr:PE domain-containing protein [Actinomycetospora sp. DW7H6]MDD7968567.1 PE domain-containing protein [Actinomycetospora sp. DW7H6]